VIINNGCVYMKLFSLLLTGLLFLGAGLLLFGMITVSIWFCCVFDEQSRKEMATGKIMMAIGASLSVIMLIIMYNL
jgi:hypothetical protein